MRVWLVVALPVAGLLTVSCFTDPLVPVLGYENNDQYCDDGLDNDHDSLVDCDDPDCFVASTLCGLIVPPDPILEPEGIDQYDRDGKLLTCQDGVDNDLDGQFDCGDRGCQAVAETCCSDRESGTLCNDGIDNDQNGRTDCEDRTCEREGFQVYCFDMEPAQFCGDGVDNDGDGDTDCADCDCIGDLDCAAQLEGDTVDSCTDGCDNDANGFLDCNDFSCSQSAVAEVRQLCESLPKEVDFETCSDGIDQDQNGYVDCNDFSCQGTGIAELDEFCAEAGEASLAKCSDGVDNDGNGYVDCGDYSCSKSEDPAVQDHCASQIEATIEACTDGIDNDENGYGDCDDYSCSRSDDLEVQKTCHGLAEKTGVKCSDGVDNDGNGYVDCIDNGCVDPDAACQAPDPLRAPDVRDALEAIRKDVFDAWQACSEVAACAGDGKTQEEVAYEACRDGVDNDGDGFPDCLDWECNYYIWTGPDPCEDEPRKCE